MNTRFKNLNKRRNLRQNIDHMLVSLYISGVNFERLEEEKYEFAVYSVCVSCSAINHMHVRAFISQQTIEERRRIIHSLCYCMMMKNVMFD